MTTKLINLKQELIEAVRWAPTAGYTLVTENWGVSNFSANDSETCLVAKPNEDCKICALSALLLYRQARNGGCLPIPQAALSALDEMRDVDDNDNYWEARDFDMEPDWWLFELLDLDNSVAIDSFIEGFDHPYNAPRYPNTYREDERALGQELHLLVQPVIERKQA